MSRVLHNLHDQGGNDYVTLTEDFNKVGEVVNSLLDKRLRMLARDLVVYGKLIRGQFLQDLSSDVIDTFVARYR
jgi:hypothetical protein